MRNGICPKCGYADVRMGKQVRLEELGPGGQALDMQVFTVNVRVQIDVYVCGYCGYVEMGLLNGDDLAKIRERWPRITPA